MRLNPALSAAGILAVALPPLVALVIHGPAIFPRYEKFHVPDHQIAVLLQGEQLVPPPPLPPRVFTDPDVEAIRPGIASANRNWALLDPEFRQRLLSVMKIMRDGYGYDMALLEGFRSPGRQARLAAKGGDEVTDAGAYMSYHQYGLAADCAFVLDGKLVISEKNPWAMRGYELYGKVAQSVGLTWGGNWKLRDYGHLELQRPGVLGHPLPPRLVAVLASE